MGKRELINKSKALFGIRDFSLMKKKLGIKVGKMLYRKTYTADDIVQMMASMGMNPGDVVFVHSSMMAFYNYRGTAEELIDKLITYLGPEGTLAMPCFPANFRSSINNCLTEKYNGIDDPIYFDVVNTPSGAGYLTEVFRRYPNARRSMNFQHSVCAVGKQADYLISEHQDSLTCWDEKSPYYKLTLLHAKIFSLGLPYFLATVIHCVDSVLYGKYDFFDVFFNKDITYNSKDANGKLVVCHSKTNTIPKKQKKKRLCKRYFDKEQILLRRLSNLKVYKVNADYTFQKFLELAEKGIVIYTEPNPKKFDWTPRR